MKRFVSRYEKIRHLRAQQEDVCRAAAAARNAERIAECERRRDEAELRLSRFETEAAAGMKLGITGSILQSIATQIERAKHQIKLDNEALRLADDRLDTGSAGTQGSQSRTQNCRRDDSPRADRTSQRTNANRRKSTPGTSRTDLLPQDGKQSG
jgi:hypothetical protein